MPRFLTLSEVLLILQNQIKLYGGKFGIRDISLLSSALAMPEAMFSGQYLHNDLFDKAAAYAFHICQNHPFIDGNKRVALASSLVFLDLNGVELSDPNESLYKLMMNVASGKIDKKNIAKHFRSLSEVISKGEGF